MTVGQACTRYWEDKHADMVDSRQSWPGRSAGSRSISAATTLLVDIGDNEIARMVAKRRGEPNLNYKTGQSADCQDDGQPHGDRADAADPEAGEEGVEGAGAGDRLVGALPGRAAGAGARGVAATRKRRCSQTSSAAMTRRSFSRSAWVPAVRKFSISTIRISTSSTTA